MEFTEDQVELVVDALASLIDKNFYFIESEIEGDKQGIRSILIVQHNLYSTLVQTADAIRLAEGIKYFPHSETFSGVNSKLINEWKATLQSFNDEIKLIQGG